MHEACSRRCGGVRSGHRAPGSPARRRADADTGAAHSGVGAVLALRRDRAAEGRRHRFREQHHRRVRQPDDPVGEQRQRRPRLRGGRAAGELQRRVPAEPDVDLQRLRRLPIPGRQLRRPPRPDVAQRPRRARLGRRSAPGVPADPDIEARPVPVRPFLRARAPAVQRGVRERRPQVRRLRGARRRSGTPERARLRDDQEPGDDRAPGRHDAQLPPGGHEVLRVPGRRVRPQGSGRHRQERVELHLRQRALRTVQRDRLPGDVPPRAVPRRALDHQRRARGQGPWTRACSMGSSSNRWAAA